VRWRRRPCWPQPDGIRFSQHLAGDGARMFEHAPSAFRAGLCPMPIPQVRFRGEVITRSPMAFGLPASIVKRV